MMLFFRTLPLLVQLGIGLGAFVTAGGMIAAAYHKIEQHGYDRAIDDIANENQEAVNAADKARNHRRACNATPGMRWDTSAGQCVRGDV